MIRTLTSRRALAILGMNSGTSADGIDLAVITFSPNARKSMVRFLDGAVIRYPRSIKSEIDHLIQDESLDAIELARRDMAYGRYLGTVARKFISARGHKVDLIASHGQTVGHYPAREKVLGFATGATIQIGDGNALAAGSGLPVVSDFRRADIALGGEGAPLTPFVNNLLFAHRGRSRVIVNIGGIANYSYHPAGGGRDDIRGGDCGPGNILSDLASRLLFHKPFDRDGALARKGRVAGELTALILDANTKRGRSAGREQFDRYLLARLVHMTRRIRGSYFDLLASIDDTVAALIHRSIARHLKDPRIDGVYLTGGGRRNLFMVEQLQKRCRPVRVWPIEALGYDGDFLEAISFAVLGGCFVYGVTSTLPKVTGADSGGIAGRLSWPPGKPAF